MGIHILKRLKSESKYSVEINGNTKTTEKWKLYVWICKLFSESFEIRFYGTIGLQVADSIQCAGSQQRGSRRKFCQLIFTFEHLEIPDRPKYKGMQHRTLHSKQFFLSKIFFPFSFFYLPIMYYYKQGPKVKQRHQTNGRLFLWKSISVILRSCITEILKTNVKLYNLNKTNHKTEDLNLQN